MPKVRKLSKDELDSLEEKVRLIKGQQQREVSRVIEGQFPLLAWWVQGGGWIEFGETEYSRSLVRVLDIGGMLWESKKRYRSLDEMLQAAEQALQELDANGDL